MGYKTFSQLPVRSTVTGNDFLISDRAGAATSPEARIDVDILKNYILKGNIDETGYYENNQQIPIDTKNSVVDTRNGTNPITFENLNKTVYGFFEIRCTYAQAPSSLAAIYSLSWNSFRGKAGVLDKNLITNRVLDVKKDTSDKDGLSTHHLFIPPFVPETSGWFRVDVKFTSKIANKKANIAVDFWTFQIK